MHLDFTPEQKQLRAEIRASLEAVMTPERRAVVANRLEGGPEFKECVQALGAAHLLGVGWPKEYGGRGFSAIEQFIFNEEIQRANAPIPLVTLNTVGPTLMQYGTEEQKQTFLPAILDGTVEFAIGYSEPAAGSDLASLRTTAVRDGDDVRHQRAEDVHQRCDLRRLHLARGAHRPAVEETQGYLDLHRADIIARVLMEAAAHHAGHFHLLHVL